MSRLRATVTLPYTTALPGDVVMNTSHFLTATSPASAGELAEINTNLQAFYNSDFGIAGNPISSYISDQVSRVADACTVEIWDLADAEPRQPVFTDQWTLGAAGAAGSLPNEVALCASFQAVPISGVPQARRRGRWYIGPLNANADHLATGRPEAAFIAALIDAMAGFSTLFGGSGVAWTIYSRVGDAMAEVDNGWVDNAWDTQRRRGQAPTVRTTW